ncbi:MAG: RecB family exonuclease [Actinomycetes bacterium]
MPRRLYACTPTRLTTWLDCPRRYRFSYLDRPQPPKGPPWAHNSLGASVHTALASWFRLAPSDRTPEAAGRLLDDAWLSEGFRDDDQSQQWRARAREMVVRYAGGLDPAHEPMGVERTVATRTDVLALSGRIDRLDERVLGGETQLVVVDYKTGRHLLTTDDARSSLALAVYALAAERVLRRPCLRVELHHLPTGSVVVHDHTRESLQRHLGRAEDIGREASTADAAYHAGLEGPEMDRTFPPSVSPSCRWCDFVQSCPDGLAAVTPAPSWSGLADAGGA